MDAMMSHPLEADIETNQAKLETLLEPALMQFSGV